MRRDLLNRLLLLGTMSLLFLLAGVRAADTRDQGAAAPMAGAQALAASQGAAQPDAAVEPQATDDEPELFVSGENIESMALSRGMLFWSSYSGCPGFEFQPTCKIGSKPAGDGWQITRYNNASGARDDDLDSNVAVDANYFYWIAEDGDILRLRRFGGSASLADLIATRENNASSGQIAVDENYVYWTENIDVPGTSSDSGKLFRAPKEGGARQLMNSRTQTTLRQLQADGAGGALYIAHSCGGICFPDVLHRTYHNGATFLTTTANYVEVDTFASDGVHVFWATTGDVDSSLHLRRAPLSNLGSSTEGPQLWADDSREVRAMTVDEDNLYWHLYHGISGGPIFRLAKSNFSSATPTAITTNHIVVKDLQSNNRFLFWHDNQAIYRLATDAAAYEVDASVADIEVTQGIQDLDNTIPLVHKRWTMVRVYPGLSTSNFSLGTATVLLHGARDGAPLPGSPLTARHVNARTAGYDRRLHNDSANFVLPASWREGDVSLRAEVSIFGLHDTNLANNSRTVSVSFTPKSNICVKFLPIATTAHLTYYMRNPVSGTFTPGFLDIVDRFRTLWPSQDVRYYSQGLPLRKPCFLCGSNDPFNMADKGDQGWVLHALWEHNVFDEAPAWCSAEGARTHYVAMVHTGVSTGSSGGLGRLADPLSWVKMYTGGSPIDDPAGGGVLVHEIGHNHNGLFGDRWNHIDCGLPAGEDPYDGYPYNPMYIGVPGPRTSWGYDRRSNTIIRPHEAADYMSYCDPAWTSDHNWLGAMDGTNNTSSPIAAAPDGASGLVAVSGMIASDESAAELILAYRLPAPLAASVTPPASQSLAGLAPEATPDGDYRLQLLSGSGAVLVSQPVTPLHDSEQQAGATYSFMATMPDEPGAAALRLTRDGVELARRAISDNAPVVSNVTPAAGASYGDRLPISWNGSDADGDPLHYVVQYSPDGGASWQAIATGVSGTRLTVSDTRNLAGSENARVRVIANDGFNVGMATSGAFTLQPHAPEAIIGSPLGGEAFAVNDEIVVEGNGIDAEDGYLSGSALQWQLSGPSSSAASGEQFALNNLAPGSYTLQLTATDSDGEEGVTTSTFVISPKRVYDGSAPALDGYCDDEAYGDDLQPLSIAYGGGDAALVRFVRASGAVYVCFSGLEQGLHADEQVRLNLDVNNSGGAALGAGDRLFVLRRDGGLITGEGLSGGGVTYHALPQGLSGMVSEAGGVWAAEMRIEEAQWGGWNHLLRLQASHANRSYSGDNYVWPAGAGANAPGEWGLAALGRQAQSITFAPLPDVGQEQGPLALDASSSSGLPVTFTSLTPDVCEAGGNVLDLLTPGSCTIRASQPGDDSYNPAANITRSFELHAPKGPYLYLPFFHR